MAQLRHFYRDHYHHHHRHHHHHHHHHITDDVIMSAIGSQITSLTIVYSTIYPGADQSKHQRFGQPQKIHIFTKGFEHIECGCFLRDHAGFHEHNEPRVVLYKLWHDIINSHTCLYFFLIATCHTIHHIFVVVNFDALPQASDIQIERRQVVFLCWMQELNPGPQTPNRQQTECSLTNRLSYRGSS